MKHIALALVAAVTVTACNTPPKELGTIKLCEKYLWGTSDRAAVENEVRNRGLDCNAYSERIQADRAANQAKKDEALRNMAIGAQIMNSGRQQQMQPSQPSMCTSQWIGNQWRTVCN